MLVLPTDALLLLTPIIWAPDQFRATVAMALLSLLMITGRGRYRARLHLSVLDEIPALLGNLFTSAAVIATFIALRYAQDDVTDFLMNAAISIAFVVVGRMVTTFVINSSRHRRITVHPTVLIGGGELSTEIARILADHPRYGLRVVGYVEDDADHSRTSTAPWLGTSKDLDRIVAENHADVLLIADGALSEDDLLDAVRTPNCLPCDLLIVPRMHLFHTQTGLADHIGSIPIMRIRNPKLSGPAWLIKRLFDIVVSGIALLLLSPIIVAAMLAIRVESGPDVIFKQPRVGRDGQLFNCLKLRSMRPANQAESSTNWSIANDARVSKVGKFLRRTSLDELPQLWNIICGDMTLVGPRPERPHFVEQFSAQYDRYNHRHRVRAGLTGLAQVSGLRGDTSIADRARFDNFYIENWSLWLDVKIIVRTFSEVFFARGR